MPANRNVKGGKGYKKGKKGNSGGAERESAFEFRGPGQDYGRVVRLLGNRRVAIYCNDGVERNCKIRGAMCRGPKKQILNVGDVVLFSLRNFDDPTCGDSDSEDERPVGLTGGNEGGDIILKYEHNQLRQLRKEDGVNPNIFVTSETPAAGAKSTVDIFASTSGNPDAVEHVDEDGDGAPRATRMDAFGDVEGGADDLDIDLI